MLRPAYKGSLDAIRPCTTMAEVAGHGSPLLHDLVRSLPTYLPPYLPIHSALCWKSSGLTALHGNCSALHCTTFSLDAHAKLSPTRMTVVLCSRVDRMPCYAAMGTRTYLTCPTYLGTLPDYPLLVIEAGGGGCSSSPSISSCADKTNFLGHASPIQSSFRNTREQGIASTGRYTPPRCIFGGPSFSASFSTTAKFISTTQAALACRPSLLQRGGSNNPSARSAPAASISRRYIDLADNQQPSCVYLPFGITGVIVSFPLPTIHCKPITTVSDSCHEEI
ncbi:hypothetical protein LZ31DRAFT_80284 [Colletotrichum somersetense]|nr:hypothetical protein LZ31DRAFT_80284 [Colletotrichum somersetense]